MSESLGTKHRTHSVAPHATSYHAKHVKPSRNRTVIVRGGEGADLIDTINDVLGLTLKSEDWHAIAPHLNPTIIHKTQGDTGIAHYRLDHFGPLSDNDKQVFVSFAQARVAS